MESDVNGGRSRDQGSSSDSSQDEKEDAKFVGSVGPSGSFSPASGHRPNDLPNQYPLYPGGRPATRRNHIQLPQVSTEAIAISLLVAAGVLLGAFLFGMHVGGKRARRLVEGGRGAEQIKIGIESRRQGPRTEEGRGTPPVQRPAGPVRRDGKFTIQIVSYTRTHFNKARDLVDRLKSRIGTHEDGREYDVFIQKSPVSGNKLAVCVGRFAAKDDGDTGEMLRMLKDAVYEGKKQFADAMVVKISGTEVGEDVN